jgi:hypothetical protein
MRLSKQTSNVILCQTHFESVPVQCLTILKLRFVEKDLCGVSYVKINWFQSV